MVPPPVEAISRCEDLVSMKLYSESFNFVGFSSWRHLLLNYTLATGPHCADTQGWAGVTAVPATEEGSVVLTDYIIKTGRQNIFVKEPGTVN